MRGVFQTAAFERHQSLIAAHVGPLIDGHGEMPASQQCTGILAVLEPLRIEARIGAQAVRRLEVHDQERHRAIGLGLQNEAAIEFQRRAEQRRQHDRFAEQLADRRRIIVLGRGHRRARGRAGSSGRADRARSTSNGSTASSTGTADGARIGVSTEVLVSGIVRSWRFIWGRKVQNRKGGIHSSSSPRKRGPITTDGCCCTDGGSSSADYVRWSHRVRSRGVASRGACADPLPSAGTTMIFLPVTTPPPQSTTPECPFARAGDFRLRRTPPTAGRRSPRR